MDADLKEILGTLAQNLNLKDFKGELVLNKNVDSQYIIENGGKVINIEHVDNFYAQHDDVPADQMAKAAPAAMGVTTTDFSQVTREQFQRACVLLEREQYFEAGKKQKLIQKAGNWYYVGRIMHEAGFFKADFQTLLMDLVNTASVIDKKGESHIIQKRIYPGVLSKESKVFGQSMTKLFDPDPAKRWHVNPPSFNENDLAHAIAIAKSFVGILQKVIAGQA